jgi:antirestriction protein ArdC
VNSKTAPQTAKADVYARVTDRIVEDLAAGVRPWMKPWSAGHADGRISRPLRHNGTPYRGVNVLLLWGEAQAKGFGSPSWMTYKQAQELGGQVRKDEAGSMVVYADRYTKSETNERGEEAEREVAFMKGYTVFNVEQIDGLPAQYLAPVAPVLQPLPLHQAAEAFFTATGATFCHGGSRAFYAPARDFIQLPPAEAFRDAESYAATKAHELIHWTGHPHRNAR